MKKRTYEILFVEETNQEEDEPLDTVNEALVTIFGEDCEIDWRDGNTVYVTTTAVEVEVIKN